jgi:hypothetical protein
MPYTDIISSVPFKFCVGPDKKSCFYLHSDLVSQQSQPLARLINGDMKEGQERCAHLAEVDDVTFTHFSQFIYTGDYCVVNYENQPSHAPPSTENPKESPRVVTPASRTTNARQFYQLQTPTRSTDRDKPAEYHADVLLFHAKVYVFADCYDIKALAALSVQKLEEASKGRSLKGAGLNEVAEWIEYCYQNTHDRDGHIDPLRALINKYAARQINELVKSKAFKQVVKVYGDFATGLVEEMAGLLASSNLASGNHFRLQ